MQVNLTKRVVVAGKDRFCPVAVAGNGRLKPDLVVVDGIEERHPEGRYYIDWTVGGRRRRQSVGKSASNAVARQLRKQAELKAQAAGLELVPEPGERTGVELQAAVAEYLGDIKLHKKKKTLQAYTTSVTYFLESCRKQYLEDIDRRDLLRFSAFLREEKEQAPRSCWNKFANVVTFLKSVGITRLTRKGDWPDYVEEQPEIYEKEELDKFFAVCSPEERLIFEFFLMTGFRDQETMYVAWPDFKPRQGIVRMTWKPKYKWTPKAYKEREVPVPDTLVVSLEAVGAQKTGLIFGTENDGPNFHFLETCKSIAERAGLDPAEWWLHKFRATFATWHLQGGPFGTGKAVDLRTVQEWMGHVDLKSTMRYLRPARNETVRDRVNATFG